LTIRRPLLLAVLAAGAVCAPAQAGPARDRVGVYRVCCNPDAVRAHEQWLGRPVYRVLDFLADEDWSKIENPDWWVQRWKASPYASRMVWSVPMLVDDRGDGKPATLAECATGAYAPRFRKLAQKLAGNGFGGSTIRLGWEMNGDWYRWGLGFPGNTAADYAKCWRSAVWAMRIPGAWFTFDWTTGNGGPWNAEAAYPGDAVVDLIGQDVYHTAPFAELKSRPFGLEWHRAFAARHGKKVSFPEWGLWTTYGDQPLFVDYMYGWIDQSNVAYHNEWEGSLGCPCGNKFMFGYNPRSAARFRALFGAP
jgi:Glycosyl hydrolase family 26